MSSKKICFVCHPPNANIFDALFVKCIIFEHDNEGNVIYATSMFKKESRRDLFKKHKQKNITEKRFKENPKYIKITKNFDKMEKEIICQIDKVTEQNHV